MAAPKPKMTFTLSKDEIRDRLKAVTHKSSDEAASLPAKKPSPDLSPLNEKTLSDALGVTNTTTTTKERKGGKPSSASLLDLDVEHSGDGHEESDLDEKLKEETDEKGNIKDLIADSDEDDVEKSSSSSSSESSLLSDISIDLQDGPRDDKDKKKKNKKKKKSRSKSSVPEKFLREREEEAKQLEKITSRLESGKSVQGKLKRIVGSKIGDRDEALLQIHGKKIDLDKLEQREIERLENGEEDEEDEEEEEDDAEGEAVDSLSDESEDEKKSKKDEKEDDDAMDVEKPLTKEKDEEKSSPRKSKSEATKKDDDAVKKLLDRFQPFHEEELRVVSNPAQLNLEDSSGMIVADEPKSKTLKQSKAVVDIDGQLSAAAARIFEKLQKTPLRTVHPDLTADSIKEFLNLLANTFATGTVRLDAPPGANKLSDNYKDLFTSFARRLGFDAEKLVTRLLDRIDENAQHVEPWSVSLAALAFIVVNRRTVELVYDLTAAREMQCAFTRATIAPGDRFTMLLAKTKDGKVFGLPFAKFTNTILSWARPAPKFVPTAAAAAAASAQPASAAPIQTPRNNEYDDEEKEEEEEEEESEEKDAAALEQEEDRKTLVNPSKSFADQFLINNVTETAGRSLAVVVKDPQALVTLMSKIKTLHEAKNKIVEWHKDRLGATAPYMKPSGMPDMDDAFARDTSMQILQRFLRVVPASRVAKHWRQVPANAKWPADILQIKMFYFSTKGEPFPTKKEEAVFTSLMQNFNHILYATILNRFVRGAKNEKVSLFDLNGGGADEKRSASQQYFDALSGEKESAVLDSKLARLFDKPDKQHFVLRFLAHLFFKETSSA